jgi:glutamine---fructose-6-phosphate transaminase (isomerizing)
MCGIIGYIGKKNAYENIINGLKKLEYRGYDSWGFLVYNQGNIFLEKFVGKISEYTLEKNIFGNVGIGHTRWATHGKVSEVNAHPHFDCAKKIFVVHNGIIENFEILKKKLLDKDHFFISETDTEVIPHLIEEFQKSGLSYKEAIFETVKNLRGSFALVIFNLDEPNLLTAIRLASPLIVGIGEKEFLVASDPMPIKMISSNFIPLNDEEIIFLKEDGDFELKSFENKQRSYVLEKIDWELEEAELGGFPDFMLKEIFESPRAVRNTLRGRIFPEKGEVKLGGIELVENKIRKIEKVILTGCGTAFYAALIGKLLLEDLAGVPTEAEIASELKYRSYQFNPKVMLIAVSQSGETADTLEAVKEAKRKSALTIGIVNVPGSTISREVEAGIYTYAGPERAVASTKAFYSQIIALLLLSVFIGRRTKLTQNVASEILYELQEIPKKMEIVLEKEKLIKDLAFFLKNENSILYLGRKYSYPVALEGALKIKEIAYIHGEGYPGGEMKHGPLALIEDGFPVVFIAPKDSLYSKSLSNIEEIKARGGKVILISTNGDKPEVNGDSIYVPQTLEFLTPLLTTLPLHLLAYYTAKSLGRNIDRPRNLAKSVTVE